MTDPSNLNRELSAAYLKFAKLQTQLDEDDYIISMLQSGCGGESDNIAPEKVVARRKSLNRELRKVKKRICEIEER